MSHRCQLIDRIQLSTCADVFAAGSPDAVWCDVVAASVPPAAICGCRSACIAWKICTLALSAGSSKDTLLVLGLFGCVPDGGGFLLEDDGGFLVLRILG